MDQVRHRVRTICIALTGSQDPLEDNQADAFVHQDKQHKHIHLYINRIGFDGKAYKDNFIGKRAQKAAERVALKLKLQTIRQIKEQKLENVKDIRKFIKKKHEKYFKSLSNSDLKEIARKSTLSILDSKRKLTNDIIENFTFVKLNESERLNNLNLTTDNIITTLGKKGAEYKNILFESPNPQDTIDVSGAGDTFTAAFIIKYYQLKNEEAAIKFANRKSSEVVSQRGVVTPEFE